MRAAAPQREAAHLRRARSGRVGRGRAGLGEGGAWGRPPVGAAPPSGSRSLSARLGPGWDAPFSWVPVGPRQRGGGSRGRVAASGPHGTAALWRQPRPSGVGPSATASPAREHGVPGTPCSARTGALNTPRGSRGTRVGPDLFLRWSSPSRSLCLVRVEAGASWPRGWGPLSGVCYPHHSLRGQIQRSEGSLRAELASEKFGLKLEQSLPHEGRAEKDPLRKQRGPQGAHSGSENGLSFLPPSPTAVA